MTDTTLSSSAMTATPSAPLAAAGPTLRASLAMVWALLFGMGAAMIANGVQGPLFGLRAGLEDFSTTLTGLIMAGYFAGFAAGSLIVPTLVARVGHIRVFAALASLVSIAAILPPVIVNPWAWCLLRFLIGLG